MKAVLFILALVTLLSGAGFLVAAKTAIHEIEGFILFLITAVLISGASTVEAVDSLRQEIATANKPAHTA